MELKDIKKDIPGELFNILEKDIKELRPCQEKAVKKGLLERRNLLICTPTASGKTLTGELAAISSILKGFGKAVYIVPLKALASEKFNDFKKKYGELLKVAMSIGDIDSADPYLADYDLIITTSEKLDSLTRHHTPWLSRIGTVIVDEIHLMNDSGRGPTLEILLTILKQILKDVQIVGLSATIGNPEELAEWLDARLVIEKIKEDLKPELVEKPIRRSKIEKTIEDSLKKSIGSLFTVKPFDLLSKIKQKKPYVICFVGINGSGKTTTIAKVAQLLLDNNQKIVLAAADTFRAAAIDQLQIHADKLGVKLIKHDYGSDPAAVAFDAIKHAESKNLDVVLVDTAGRMHANSNLMEEMSKIVRVAKPDMKIFVGESITGNDCVEQAKKFDEAVGIDAIILSKADVDEKGGAAVSVSYVTKKPIIYIGVGQEYKDLKEFDSDIVLKNLGLDA